MKQYNLETGWKIKDFASRTKEVGCLCVLRLRRDWELVGGGWDRKMCGWGVHGKKRIVHHGGHQGDITVVVQVEAGMLASGDSSGVVAIWSLVAATPLKKFQLAPVDGEEGGSASSIVAVEDMVYLKSRRLLLVGSADGRIVALSATTLATNTFSSTLKTFAQASVDALCLDRLGHHLMVQDSGHRLRLWHLGEKGHKHTLIRCWQPLNDYFFHEDGEGGKEGREKGNEGKEPRVPDARIAYQEDRGSVSFLSCVNAFVTAQIITRDRKIGVDAWSAATGESVWTLYWPCTAVPENGMLKSRRRRESIKAQQDQRKRLAEALGGGPREAIGPTKSHIPKPPVLFSLGEFALELDRMKLLEKKSAMIGSILNGSGGRENGEIVASEGGIRGNKFNVAGDGEGEGGGGGGGGDHDVVRSAKARLARQLHQLHQKGVICKGTPLKHLKAKLASRKHQSELRAVQSMKW